MMRQNFQRFCSYMLAFAAIVEHIRGNASEAMYAVVWAILVQLWSRDA